ncbi:MAG: GNAT family protein [Betaproteobacteria bacterium]
MPTRTKRPAVSLTRRGRIVTLRPPQRADEQRFLTAVAASRKLHDGWVKPPASTVAFAAYVKRYAREPLRDPASARHAGFVVCERGSEALAGTFNLSEIIHGALQSAFLGYYAFAGMEGRGLMREGLALSLDAAFSDFGLHRVEVNVQPANVRSIALVEGAGFGREGFSPRYVKVAGRWRDHVRYAMLRDDWRRLRTRA